MKLNFEFGGRKKYKTLQITENSNKNEAGYIFFFSVAFLTISYIIASNECPVGKFATNYGSSFCTSAV